MSRLSYPVWCKSWVDPKLLTPEKLAAMREQAEGVDKANLEGFALVTAAYAAYVNAARDFGTPVRTVKRLGSTYVSTPVPPGGCTTRLDSLIREYEAHVKAEESARAAKEDAARRRAEAGASALRLGRMLQRYGLGDLTWPELLDELCSRSKYLDLAVAGLRTRTNWSDGFWLVEDALSRFRASPGLGRTADEERLDDEIAADISSCLESEDGDGRVFRDTIWNYEELFKLVCDEQLVADAKECLAEVEG